MPRTGSFALRRRTLTAPAGSLTVSPLSTLVQKMMAGGRQPGDRRATPARSCGVLAWAADTDFTTLDPLLSTLNGLADGAKSFVAEITVADVVALATAAGVTGDLYGMLASMIAAGSGSFDPTSVTTMQGIPWPDRQRGCPPPPALAAAGHRPGGAGGDGQRAANPDEAGC